MRSLRSRAILSLGAMAALFVLAGCSDDQTTSTGDVYDPSSQTVNLNDAYGGFLPVDEDPAFDDPVLEASAAREEPQANGYAGLSPGEQTRAHALENNPAHAAYCLALLWGELDLPDTDPESDPPPAGDAVAWDGSLLVSAGAIKVLSLVDFERGQDELLPRAARQSLAWRSTTEGDFDGLRVLVLQPPDPTGSVSYDSLTLVVGAYTRTFQVEDLAELDELVEFADGTELSLRGFLVDPLTPAAAGFCSGRWGWAEGDSVGTFRGHWIGGRDGALVGYMRGHYGFDDQGRAVFFGKYIHLDGGFGGFLRGEWEASGMEQDPIHHRHGSFHGEWVSRDGYALGRLRGHWARTSDGPGVFSGAWRGGRITPGH